MNTDRNQHPSMDDPRLNPSVMSLVPYAQAELPGPVALWLNNNEASASAASLSDLQTLEDEVLRRYPDARPLESMIAAKLGVAPSCVLVTAGGDDAIDRVCQACLGPGREIVLPTPTFEMIRRYATIAGAEIREVEWNTDQFPIRSVLHAISDRTGVIAVVTPNNPTGAVATKEDLSQLSRAAPWATLLVDLAYTEFADVDLTKAALALPNAVIIRTLSKAYGLAGLRVGYAAGPERLIRALRSAGSPYPTSAISLRVASEAISAGQSRMRRAIEEVRQERSELQGLLSGWGASAGPSQGNFVLARTRRAEWVWRALGAMGLSVRPYPGRKGLADALRITCPGNAESFRRLAHGLETALRPEAILLDMDSVLVDASAPSQRAMAETAATFGVRVTPAAIDHLKAAPRTQNALLLTHRLVQEAGIDVSREEVVRRFESIYLGTDGNAGLRELETLTTPRGTLVRLASRVRLGLISARPRRACDDVLRRFGLETLVAATVCADDGTTTPDNGSVATALTRLGASRAWMVTNTPEAIFAARDAGVVPIGCLPDAADTPDRSRAATLERSGAARVVTALEDLLEILP